MVEAAQLTLAAFLFDGAIVPVVITPSGEKLHCPFSESGNGETWIDSQVGGHH